MVERVIEWLWLTLCHRVVEVVATLWTWTTLTTLWTWTTTLTTFWTWTTLTLYISLWLLKEYTARELVLTSLWINLEELHLKLITLLDTSLLYGLETLPVNL